MITLEQHIEQNARLRPQQTAVVCGDQVLTYADLWQRVSEEASRLRPRLTSGRIVSVRTSQTAAFLVSYFALHCCGCTVAPMEHDMPEALFQQLTDRLSRYDLPPGTADVLYTTGTTGRSKGVMISHRAIMASAENLVEGQGFSPGLAFVVSGPLNHLGSLSKVWAVMTVGATLVVTEGMKDLNRFFAALDQPFPRMATFLVPASIRMLLQFSASRLGRYQHKIDFIETGAAAISQADMDALRQLLPNSRLYNTYASTETGVVSTCDFSRCDCTAGCLGRPMRHSRVVITPEGHIACQGDTLMSGYVGDEELTRSVLRDGTVYTRDVGRLDAEGRLHLAGREDDVINVGGFKVAPTEVEGVAMELSEVLDCICVPVSHPLVGTALKLLVVLQQGTVLDKKRLARHIASKLERYKVPMVYEQTDKVQRTYNGKVDRKYYVSTPQSTTQNRG